MSKKAAPSSAILSMTGFGKGAAQGEHVSIEVEIRSINHRFLDFVCKLPRAYNEFEPELRALVGGAIGRGRVDLSVTRQTKSATAVELRYDGALFSSLWQAYQQGLAAAGVPAGAVAGPAALAILGRREVVDVVEGSVDTSSERELLLTAARAALENLRTMRVAEGERLERDLRTRLGQLRVFREKIAGEAAAAPGGLRDRLLARVKKLAPDVTLDENRFAQEVAYLADRADVTEELVRLESHFAQFEQALAAPPSGRRLDFLMQELGREFNTIGSKGQSAAVQNLVVDAKCELEKMREQVQNVE